MDNKIILERRLFKGYYVNVYETPRMILGFTELGFPASHLELLFPNHCQRVLHLNQVHGNTVFFSSALTTGVEPDGDGIILDERRTLAVIQTADCTPLFFWDDAGNWGGVLHIGWQGLLSEIERITLALLEDWKLGVNPRQLNYYLGPAIEPRCYEVGQNLVDKFAHKGYGTEIFAPHPIQGEKYLMDVKLGIRLSLLERGVPPSQIRDCGLCTFCETRRFPSYRRVRDSGERIYNFLLLKQQA